MVLRLRKEGNHVAAMRDHGHDDIAGGTVPRISWSNDHPKPQTNDNGRGQENTVQLVLQTLLSQSRRDQTKINHFQDKRPKSVVNKEVALFLDQSKT